MPQLLHLRYYSGAETFFEQGSRKYKFRFSSKFTKYLHQPVIPME